MSKRSIAQGCARCVAICLASLIKVANEDQLPTFRDAVRRETESMRRSAGAAAAAGVAGNVAGESAAAAVGHLVARGRGGTWLGVSDRASSKARRPRPPAWQSATASTNSTATVRRRGAFEATIHRCSTLAAPEFTLLIERRGHVRTVTVKMPSV